MTRRVVSGLNSKGQSCIMADGEPLQTHRFGGFAAAELWRSRPPAPDLSQLGDLTAEADFQINLAPGESSFRMITIPPLSGGEDSSAMHETTTIDYIVIVEGEIDLAFEDGSEAHLRPGDCVMQGGVMHSWRNRSGKPCTFAAIMIGATGAA